MRMKFVNERNEKINRVCLLLLFLFLPSLTVRQSERSRYPLGRLTPAGRLRERQTKKKPIDISGARANKVLFTRRRSSANK